MSPDEEAVRRLGSTATNDARRAAEDTAQAFERRAQAHYPLIIWPKVWLRI